MLSIRPAAVGVSAASAMDVKLASDAAKAQFEAMIHDKLASDHSLFLLRITHIRVFGFSGRDQTIDLENPLVFGFTPSASKLFKGPFHGKSLPV